MTYQTVFEASEKGYDWLWLIAPFLIPILAFWTWRQGKRVPLASETAQAFRSCGSVFIGVVSLCIAIAVLLTTTLGHSQAQQMLANNTAQIVEGVTSSFTPEPFLGHASESFKVNNIFFKYSTFEVTSGFNTTSVRGGPINRNGIPVRIHYYPDSNGNNVIIKLEIEH